MSNLVTTSSTAEHSTVECVYVDVAAESPSEQMARLSNLSAEAAAVCFEHGRMSDAAIYAEMADGLARASRVFVLIGMANDYADRKSQ